RLDVELPRDGQECLAAEEILREIDLAVGGARQVRDVQGRDTKHRSRPLGIGTGNDRRVDPEKTVLVEKTVNRLRQRVPHPRRRADDIRARPQMRHLADVFERVRLWLNWVGFGIVYHAVYAYRAFLYYVGLTFRRR